jgi:hypothetical protein
MHSLKRPNRNGPGQSEPGVRTGHAGIGQVAPGDSGSAIKLVFANDFYAGKIHLWAGGCGVNNKRTLATPNFQFDRAVIPKKGVPIELPGNGGQVKAKLRQ